MKFSIITVSFNAGEKLRETLLSVAGQTCTDYEVIVKDGGSTDGSTDFLKAVSASERTAGAAGEAEEGKAAAISREMLSRVRFFEGKDKGIYDAMNQAAAQASGEFVLFLNCGDMFADERVLERVAAAIEREQAAGQRRLVLYGDTFSEKTGVTIASAPEITGFTCYRNIPCHQSCFYSAGLCREKPYDLQYKIRADYDHFLWCFYRAGAVFVHMDFPVASYEGGGYSESRENIERDKREHKQITSVYMGRAELFKYKAVMALTLAPLRKYMAESKAFSGMYHWVKKTLYKR